MTDYNLPSRVDSAQNVHSVGFDIQGWSRATGSCVANEVVNSVLMSGFTVTTSEVKPSELHILPICCGVKRVRRGGTDALHLKRGLLRYPPNGGVAKPSKYLGF